MPDPKRAHATRSDLERYRQFFGIVSDQELKEEADALKEKGDFTSPDSFKVRILPGAHQGEERGPRALVKSMTRKRMKPMAHS